MQMSAKMIGTFAIGSFTVSIIAAAILLLTLPEMRRTSDPIRTSGSPEKVAGRLLRMNTQAIALIESIFFGFGLLLVVAMIMITIWT